LRNPFICKNMLPLVYKIDSEYFDATSTLECGQIFRYEQVDDNAYEVISLDKKCLITTKGEYTYIYANDKDYFYNFFDLGTDYSFIANKLKQFPELATAVEYGKGIRILRQDLVETIISFIISANNNIPRIKKIIARLCQTLGKDMSGYFAFPTLKDMSKADFEIWQSLGAGFRDKYLFNTVKTLAQTNFIQDLLLLKGDEITKQLCTLSGVGPKVADCISLFGLHDVSSFPVDTWIFKACKNEQLCTAKAVRKHYTERYGGYAGIAQQYIFYASKSGIKA